MKVFIYKRKDQIGETITLRLSLQEACGLYKVLEMSKAAGIKQTTTSGKIMGVINKIAKIKLEEMETIEDTK